jgi:uncharacterized membrane protein
MTDAQVVRDPDPSLVTTLHVTYALHAVGLAIGAFGASTVIGSFIFGWPSIIAVIINYVRRGDARGTWLESHFDWQIRTFWIAVGLSILIAAVSAILVLVVIGLITWPIGFFALGVWAIYRIAKGWVRLNDRRAVNA